MAHLRAQNGKDIGQGLLEKRGPAAWPAHSTKPKQPPLCPDLTERNRGHTKPGSTRCVNFISKRCSSDTEVAALTAPLGRISQLSTATRDTTAPLQELRPYIWTHIRSKLSQVKHTCPHTDCHNYFWNNEQTCGLSSLDQRYNGVHSLYLLWYKPLLFSSTQSRNTARQLNYNPWLYCINCICKARFRLTAQISKKATSHLEHPKNQSNKIKQIA